MTHRTFSKALSLALVLAAASFGPLLLPATAFADTPKEAAGEQASAKADAPAETKPAKPAAKSRSKAKKGATTKAHAPGKAHAKHDKTASKPAKTKRAAREAKPAGKRSKPAPKADGDSPKSSDSRPQAPCTGTVVALDRGGVEAERFPLVDCKGKPLASAVTRVSVLARPWGTPRRSVVKTGNLDTGVIARIDAIARKFTGHAITLVGGPKPTGNGSSSHQAGRAVDLRVEGIDNQKLAEFCRTLGDTGCGYYPNASFVHMDVRAAGAGKSYWIDASEPGEPPRYVTSWPPRQAASKPDPDAR